jgi:carbon-monoxide dehydrogenase medium subunit
MKLRLAGPKHVDLSKIEGLSGIEMSGRTLTIGAMTPHVDVATSAVLKENPRSRSSRARSGPGGPAPGHARRPIANNDPNADYPAGVLGLEHHHHQ